MMLFLTYLLKEVVCSVLLTGYYFLALRNRAFHQWNRFYLLTAVLLSITLPLATFTVFHNTEDKGTAIQLLEAVSNGDEYVVFVTKNSAPSLSLEQGLTLAYFAVSLTAFVVLVLSLLKLRRLIKTHAVQQVHNIQFINAEAKGTPFSFFHFIFWNPAIDLQSETGKRIFKHELAHVREHHSLDKLLLQLVLVLFWCNPIFWLIRHELRMIHEFIADRKSLDQQDASALAAMILQAAYPTQFNQLTNSFFHQSIKRRIRMLTKNQKPRFSYISRILFIPLAACLVLAFSVRTKPAAAPQQAGATATPDAIVEQTRPVPQPTGMVQRDTVPPATKKPKEVNVKNGLIEVVYEDGTKSHMTIAEANVKGLNINATRRDSSVVMNDGTSVRVRVSFDGLVMVDGKEYKGDIQTLDPGTIESVNVLKGEPATTKYGSKGEKGVIEVTLKKPTTKASAADTLKPQSSLTFTQTETEARFPGGVTEWRRFLEKNLNAAAPVDHGAPAGSYTVLVQLLVEPDGTLSEIKPLTRHGYGMEEEVVRTLTLGPKWEPAKQNGRVVRAYCKQPITFVIVETDTKETEPPVTLKSGN
jgi:hypothetical protein